MTRQDLELYIKKNFIDLKKANIFLGQKSNIPFSIGCYEEEGVWYLYEVGESQNIGIVKEGNEDEVIRHLYYKIRGRVGGTI